MRMKCMRILPEMWARTLWPVSSSTRNMALGSGSSTVPSTSMASSLAIDLAPLASAARTSAAAPVQKGENIRPVLRDGHRVLEVGRQGPVGGHGRPAILQHLDVRPPCVDHRLDRKDHARFQNRPPP